MWQSETKNRLPQYLCDENLLRKLRPLQKLKPLEKKLQFENPPRRQPPQQKYFPPKYAPLEK